MISKCFRAVFILLLLISSACDTPMFQQNKVIMVQPFVDFPSSSTSEVYEKIRKTIPGTMLNTPISLPTQAYFPPRNRFRADTIIRYLGRLHDQDTVTIGLTGKDISISKKNIADWGVMGLASRPGNACVVSIFRLPKQKQSDQLFKLALHELGHTEGLAHCKNKTCFMRGAEGENHFDEQTGFCTSCKSFLKSKGWQLK
jgi:archaemetzincin